MASIPKEMNGFFASASGQLQAGTARANQFVISAANKCKTETAAAVEYVLQNHEATANDAKKTLKEV